MQMVRRTGSVGSVRGGFGARLGRGLAAMMSLPALLIFATLYALWPRATVVVSPAVSEARHKVVIQASTAAAGVDVEGGRVPARAVEDAFTVSVTVPVSGSVRSGATRARGSVVFINEGSEPVSVPEGTAVATPGGARFRALTGVVVPASTVKHFMSIAVDAVPGTAKVDVEAEEPGTHGNVAAGRITVIVGGARGGLKVMNPEPTSGGEDKITPAVSPVDLATARKRIAAEAARVAARRLTEKVSANLRVLGETIVVEQEEPVFSQAPLTPSAELRATCRASARALAVKEADVLKAARGRFLLDLGADGARVVSPEVEVKISRVNRMDAETAAVETVASAQVAAGVEPDDLARELAGRSVQEAKSLLAARPGVSGFSIHPDGGDERRLPRFPWWIRVVVGRPEAKRG
ncbi:MAG: baseplate J/gp47 family protein [Firmicutes bacterium]|nr:baseplate J/gp47 family protein [Bacillota bacterium]